MGKPRVLWLTRIERHARRAPAICHSVEMLERRVLLSAAIAAFGDQQPYLVGHNPQAIAIADVNRDGKPDLLVANNTDNTVGVLLGCGDGTFQNQQTFSTGYSSHPISITSADVNGDGKPDLIVANLGGALPGNVGVLLGNGDGTFQTQQTFSTGGAPISVATADVNGDGKPDLLVANYGSGTVSILLGNGDGTFQPEQTFDAGTHPISIAAADLNGDGKIDLALTNYSSGTVSVLLGTGTGTFQSPQTFSTGAEPRSIAIADVNGDGKPDLLVANKADGTASVLLGTGTGSFLPQQTFATGTSPNWIAASDVNVDGKPDLIVANEGDNTVGVLLGNGDGSFQPQKTFATGASPYSAAAADVNGDGRPDLVIADQTGNTVSVLLGDVPPTVLSIDRSWPPGPITSDSTVSYTVTFNEPVTGVDPTDFALALGGPTATTPVSVTPDSASVYTVTINGISGTGTLGLNLIDDGSIQDAAGNPLQQGGLAAFQGERALPAGDHPLSLVASDVNRDGKADLIVVNENSNTVSVLLGNGNGTFQSQQTFLTGLVPYSIAIADVNGDGRPDLVVANSSNSKTVSILLGNGDGTFQTQRTFTAGVAFSVAVSDVNRDGKPDLVVDNFGNTVSVLLGNGNGTFQGRQTYSIGLSSDSVFLAVSDVNGDGRPDIVVANEGAYSGNPGMLVANSVGVLLGNGDGTFQPQYTFNVEGSPHFVTIADVNGDGAPDLTVVGEADSIQVFLGNGDGTFQAARNFAIRKPGRFVAVSDINGDGKPDLIVSNYLNDSVGVLLGNGDGSFQSQQTFATGFSPTSVAVGDANGDGRLDLMVANATGYSLSVLLANTNANFTGQIYTIVPSLDIITGASGVDQITLLQNPDNQHIDWTLNGTTAEMAINDSNGLTINGNGSDDVITLQYANGNPLPNTLHLNGVFTINDLAGTNPLLNTTLEIGRSTVYISYDSLASDPIAAIRQYLQNGYNNGSWDGIPSASPAYPGAITSLPAAQNAKQTTAVGYADSADGLIAGQPVNTIELKYTLYGDTTLTGTVGFNDFTRLTQHYNQTTGGTWDTGDFNYDGSVNFADFTLMTRTYNTSLGSQASPALAPTAGATVPQGVNNSIAAPPLQVKPVPDNPHHHLIQPKRHRKHR